MALYEFAPSPPLAGFVRTIRLVHYDYQAEGPLPVKAYPPRPEHCLSFYARDFEQVEYGMSGTSAGNLRTVLFGQQTEVSNRYVGNCFLLVQVVFKPGALFRLTRIPSGQLTNQYIDAETVFPADIKLVNDQINDAKSYLQMVEAVERFLLRTINQQKTLATHPLDAVVARLFGKEPVPRVDLLSDQACLSSRQLERVFRERMGVGPKYYLKVLRFENAFRLRNQNPRLDWLSLALRCGYYDYQHLVKDYKTLTGHPPNQFHQIDLNSPERLFGLADTY
jgi:AraC-like DNA-binding protein